MQPNANCSQVCTPSIGSVSCPTASFCVAVGSDGSEAEWNGSSWSAFRSIDPNLVNKGQPMGGLEAVSCPTADFCAAVFADGNAVVGRR
jgi:hypothetical protein